jgi:hypothetical protein
MTPTNEVKNNTLLSLQEQNDVQQCVTNNGSFIIDTATIIDTEVLQKLT